MSFLIKNNTIDNNPYRNFINNSKRLNLTKDKTWLLRMFKRKRVCVLLAGKTFEFVDTLSSEDAMIYQQQFFEMIDVFERKYDNNWDIQVDYHEIRNKFYFSFIINYEYLSITNSSGHQRDIYDLLVLLPLKWNENEKVTSVGVPQGTRLTLAEDEWRVGYYHSHLTKKTGLEQINNLFAISQFCIGSEDVSELIISQQHEFDTGVFELFLYTLDNMVCWESIEGNPHYRMAKITNGIEEFTINVDNYPYHELYVSLSRAIKRQTESFFDEEGIPCNINFVFNEGRFKIKRDTNFSNFIKQHYLINNNLESHRQYALVKEGDDGRFFGYNTTTMRNVDNLLKNTQNLPFTYIQGTKHEFKIINRSEEIQEDINEYNIYPKFLNYVAEQLEIYIYESCIRGSSHHKLANTIDYVRRDSESNQIFV